MMLNEIVLASNNSGKLRELNALLAPLHCITQQELGIGSIEETGLSFIENALLKARHASRIAKKPALADDSGLVINALQGEPGIYSARYAGPNATDDDNIALLLKNMQSIADDKRQAFFYCALVFIEHADDPCPLIATGTLNGHITHRPCGSSGFGYDPIVYLQDHQCTVAELSPAIKNSISHRAQALAQLSQALRGKA